MAIFMPWPRSGRRHYAFGLSVRPSVHPYVHMYVRTSRSRYRIISRTDVCIFTKLGSCMYLGVSMNWLDFKIMRSEVKGHGAHYVCEISSLSQYLNNRWLYPYQTLFFYIAWRVNELIRFGGHEVKGQRSQRSYCTLKLTLFSITLEWFNILSSNLMYVCILRWQCSDETKGSCSRMSKVTEVIIYLYENISFLRYLFNGLSC